MSNPSNSSIAHNYQQAYQLAAIVLREKMNGRGFAGNDTHPEFIELCQSVLGHEDVVTLIQHTDFDAAAYRPVLEETLTAVQRLLFPDTRKKNFVAIDAFEWDAFADGDSAFQDDDAADITLEITRETSADPLGLLRQHLPEASADYLEKKLLKQMPDWEQRLAFLIRSIQLTGSRHLNHDIAAKLDLLRRFYPNGRVGSVAGLDGRDPLSEAVIRRIYLHAYVGIEQGYPPYFLQAFARERAAIILRFLVNEILEDDPEEILRQNDPTFFIRHKLQNIYRLFNYSANRALGCAYPEVIMPWVKSRSDANYWKDPNHRVEAVRWLLEERLQLNPANFYREQISRDVFAQNGLSYMFNSYYNSVSRSISEAYPELEPWQAGKVPFDYWTEENAARAIRWMVAEKGWTVAQLPGLTRAGILNRKTFSEFGLATLFEKKFSRNIYRTISAAWPDCFEPWEFGRVASSYWQKADNVYEASLWIAGREGINEQEIVPAIRNRRFTLKNLKKYSIGTALRKICAGNIERIFAPWFWKEQRVIRQEQRLIRKIGNLKRSQRIRSLVGYVLHGFFLHDAQTSARENIRRYDRIANRIKQRNRDHPGQGN